MEKRNYELQGEEFYFKKQFLAMERGKEMRVLEVGRKRGKEGEERKRGVGSE
jgi:hypothetical protein